MGQLVKLKNPVKPIQKTQKKNEEGGMVLKNEKSINNNGFRKNRIYN